MTDLPLNQIIGLCGALAFLAFGVVALLYSGWREVWKRGKGFAAVFLIGAAVATIHAQKPPTPPVVRGMNLRVYNVTAKGFDCAWDYGGLSPTNFVAGETVKLTAEIACMDDTLLIGALPPTVTNYHVNAVMRGLPRDWMRYDLKVTARLNNANLMGEAERTGDDTHELPSINDANGGNE